MNFKLALISSCFASTLLTQSVFAAEPIIFKNQRSSILELRRLSDNKIEGSFTTAVASKACPEAINQKRPITGYFVDNAITIAVAYPQCGSVLNFTGNFTKNDKRIDVLSILNKQSDDITHEGPGARFIGHDIFDLVE